MRRSGTHLLFCLLNVLLVTGTGLCETDAAIGREMRARLVVAGPRLNVKPQSKDANVYLRIETAQRVGERFEYVLVGSALTEGRHNLLDYLEPANPSDDALSLTEHPGVFVNVKASLPKGGAVQLSPPEMVVPLGWVPYHEGMLLTLAAWMLAPIVGLYLIQQRRIPQKDVMSVEEKSLEQRLSELAAKASLPAATAAQKARFERLALQYWRETKGLSTAPADELIPLLKHDSEIAAQLRLQDQWLHAPDGASCSVQEVLARYLQKRKGGN